RHRHHARRPELRPMPALRRAHVPRQRQGARNASFADVRPPGGAMTERIQAIEGLIRQVEESADPATRAGVRELVQAILEYHGAGLERIAELAGEPLVRQFARDELVARSEE